MDLEQAIRKTVFKVTGDRELTGKIAGDSLHLATIYHSVVTNTVTGSSNVLSDEGEAFVRENEPESLADGSLTITPLEFPVWSR